LAEKALGGCGYRIYRPVTPQTVRDRFGKPKQKSKSMFVGYIFVQPHSQGWLPLRGMPGLLSDPLLKINGQLASIDAEDPDFLAIMEAEADLWAKYRQGPAAPYRAGEMVRIQRGPWVDLLARVERVDDKQRATCLIEMLGRHTLAHVDPQAVTLVPENTEYRSRGRLATISRPAGVL
jgi:transcription antitermination factor NusG